MAVCASWPPCRHCQASGNPLRSHTPIPHTITRQASRDDDPVTAIMAAASAAAADAAAAYSRAWLDGYELAVARRQAWGGAGAREGADDVDTMRLVQELAEYGVPEVGCLMMVAVVDGWLRLAG